MIESKEIFWKFHERNDKKVAQAVRKGDVDTITGTGLRISRPLLLFSL